MRAPVLGADRALVPAASNPQAVSTKGFDHGEECSTPREGRDPMTHEGAIDALVGCARTVTVLSYQEAIEGYLRLRGMSW